MELQGEEFENIIFNYIFMISNKATENHNSLREKGIWWARQGLNL